MAANVDETELLALRETMTLDQLAEHFAVGRMTIARRLKALGVTKKYDTERVASVTAWGETKSLSAWTRDPRCNATRNGIKLRLKKGLSPEEAISEDGYLPREAFGEEKLVSDWAEDPRCVVSVGVLSSRVRKGWDLEKAIITPQCQSPSYEAFGKTMTPSEWAASDFCPHKDRSLISSRVRAGWLPEDAISEPKGDYGVEYKAFGERKLLGEWVDDKRCPLKDISTLHFRINKMGMDAEEAIASEAMEVSSFKEREVADFVAEYVQIERNTRSIIAPMELDIYVPSKSFAIEFNGVYWHSESFVPNDYHYRKWSACIDKGIQLIQIWEDDWSSKADVIKTMLIRKLNFDHGHRLYGKDMSVCKLLPSEAKRFYNDNHIQGHVLSSEVYGLRAPDGDLVAACAFKKVRDHHFDLVRYATSTTVLGGFSKLVKAFVVSHPDFREIKTFADLCVSDGDLYEKSGWTRSKVLPPEYCYVVNDQRKHKFGYRKARFERDPDLKFDPEMTERELAALNNIPRIYDAGKIRFILTPDSDIVKKWRYNNKP